MIEMKVDVTRPVEKGSLVVLYQCGYPPELIPELQRLVQEKAGHDEFTILIVDGPEAKISVLGPDQVLTLLRKASGVEPWAPDELSFAETPDEPAQQQ